MYAIQRGVQSKVNEKYDIIWNVWTSHQKLGSTNRLLQTCQWWTYDRIPYINVLIDFRDISNGLAFYLKRMLWEVMFLIGDYANIGSNYQISLYQIVIISFEWLFEINA